MRDPERGSFPVPCAGTTGDRDTLTAIARLSGVTAAFLVRQCVNTALAEVVARIAPNAVAEVEPFVSRISNKPVVAGKRGRRPRANS